MTCDFTSFSIKYQSFQVLENVEKIIYLGVTITNDLKWNTHVSNICTKANRTLGFLRRNLAEFPLDVKESSYKGLVCPIPEYGSSVLDRQSILLQDELEKVQKRAARFGTGNYVDYGKAIIVCLQWNPVCTKGFRLQRELNREQQSNEIALGYFFCFCLFSEIPTDQ